MTILAANNWKSNAEIIQDCATLGYLKKEWLILDPTYGKGTWWKLWKPDNLVIHDKKIDGVDFRKLPYKDYYFDACVYDPPYVSIGGRKSTTIPEFHEKYGLIKAPKTPKELQVLINQGLAEVARVTKNKGFILVKCQDYISSSKLWIGTHYTLICGLSIGLELFDRLEHIGNIRPQPKNRRQVHARRNLSTLFVFRKG